MTKMSKYVSGVFIAISFLTCLARADEELGDEGGDETKHEAQQLDSDSGSKKDKPDPVKTFSSGRSFQDAVDNGNQETEVGKKEVADLSGSEEKALNSQTAEILNVCDFPSEASVKIEFALYKGKVYASSITTKESLQKSALCIDKNTRHFKAPIRDKHDFVHFTF